MADNQQLPQQHYSMFHQPEARNNSASVVIADELFVFRGFLKSYKLGGANPELNHIDVFSVGSSKWSKITPTGTPPPALWGQACAAIRDKIYYYGGFDGLSFSNALHELNTAFSCWTEVQVMNRNEGPMPKSEAAMISIDAQTLLLIGGLGIPTGSPPPGSKFTMHSKFSDGSGFMNEMHLFDFQTGMYYFSKPIEVMHSDVDVIVAVLPDTSVC